MARLCEIAFDDLEFHERCGGGSFGCVYRSTWKSVGGLVVAVKKLLYLEKEAEVLNLLSHRNVIQFYGAVTKEPNFCLVTEYAAKGSLYNFLQEHEPLELEFILNWAKQIALGMNYLHEEAPIKVIHRDLKSNNVVITNDWICKICDFGSSRFLSCTTKMSLVGTYPWMAPEVIQSFPVSEKCDVWSYGVVLWELLTHEVPFNGIEGFQVAWLVVEKGKRLVIPTTCPDTFSNLMQMCWCVQPKERPTFHYILLFLEQIMNSDREDEIKVQAMLAQKRSQFHAQMTEAFFINDFLADLCEGFATNRIEWKQEIEEQLEKLKQVEREVSMKEKKLNEREMQLKRKEMEIGKQFLANRLNSYDVNSWSEIDVYQWIWQLGADKSTRQQQQHGEIVHGDMARYADLFIQNNINGKCLLLLTQDDIRNIGVTSYGHMLDLHMEIQILKQHNYRLQNFPPLNSSTVNLTQLVKSVSLNLIIGAHFQKRQSLKNLKWKLYFEVDFDDDEDEETETDGSKATSYIKSVIFANKQSDEVWKITEPPYGMETWVTGLSCTTNFDCTINFENTVKSPKNVKMVHTLDPSDLNNTTQKSVTLVLRPSDSTDTMTPGSSASRLKQSKSSPMLKNAWSMRNLENAFPPIGTKMRQETVWSGVVRGKNPGNFPAYNPKFTPVPLLDHRSRSNSPVQASSSSSASSGNGRSDSGISDVRVGMHHSKTDTCLTREVSQCSTSSCEVFSPAQRFEPIKFITGIEEDEDFENPNNRATLSIKNEQKNSPSNNPTKKEGILTLKDVSRKLMHGQEGEPNQTDNKGRRYSSPVRGYSANASADKEISDSLSKRQLHSFISENSGQVNDRRKSIDQVSDSVAQIKMLSRYQEEETLPHNSWKKKRKGSKRNSTGSNMDSLLVHGGNPKWTWRS